jgi:23S rRNA pseudouridine2457 synthase
MSITFRNKSRFHYFLFNKPYGVLSQFTAEGIHKSLKDFGPFPPTVYPVGRLDADSEGLLLLTDDDDTKHKLTDPRYGHRRTYLAQVENLPDEGELETLRNGIILNGKKTMPAEVELLASEPVIPMRPVPIRHRKTIPTCWMEITIHEGKNRQVRRMTAAIGHPTLRLLRTKIAFLGLKGLQPGEFRELSDEETLRLRQVLHATPEAK